MPGSSRSIRSGIATSSMPHRRLRTPSRGSAISSNLRRSRPKRSTPGSRKRRSRRTPLFFAVIDRATGRVEGRQTLMRISPAHRCIEIGNIYWGPRIAGTRVATEAMYLFAAYVLDTLGYRRYEWKCDALNAPSRRAAQRFGFTWEGHFRRAVIVRGRTRDTAWYAMIDEEWPALKAAYERWLAPKNFDGEGRQKTRLSELTAAALEA